MSMVNTVDFECKQDGGGGGEKPAAMAASLDEKPLGSQLNKAIAAEHRTNYVQTLMHLLNGFIGSGILSMPVTFLDGGLLVASIFNPLIGIVSCFCIHRLLAINRLITSKTKTPPMDYHELAEYTFLYGPKRFHSWSRVARRTILIALTATQIGGCCVYFVFIGTQVNKFLVNLLGSSAPSASQCLMLIVPVVLGVTMIRSLDHLSYLSAVSNILQVVSLCIIYYFLFSEPIQNVDQLPLMGKMIPQFFVSTLFIYEGISVSMSLYRSIDEPSKFSRPTGVLNVGMAIIMCFYCSIGLIGYARFGANVPDSITYILPNSAVYECVQGFYAVAVLFTYPIILYVPISIIWPIIKQRFFLNQIETQPDNKDIELESDTKKLLMRQKMIIQISNCAFRACLVLLTYLLAAVISKLELIISLVGSLTSTSIAIMIPMILHTIAFWDESRDMASRVRLILVNGIIFAIGFAAFVLGTYFSIADIIAEYSDGEIEQDPILNSTRLILGEVPLILN